MSELIKSKALKDIIQQDTVKNRLKEIMGERAPQFAAALVQIVNQSYQLQKCDASSVIGAALTAAALDLSIDPNLGMAHIVPYKDKAQFQIGYAGFAQLAQRSGQYKNLGWKVIHKGELESYDELTGELLYNSEHPDDDVIGYAAKFKLVNGFERAEYWTVKQIEDHAFRYSKAYRYAKGDKDKEENCLWVTSRDRMALKTVLKSLLKVWGPKSIQMQKALRVDDGAIVDVDSDSVEFLDNPNETEVAKPVFAEAPPLKTVKEEKPAKPAPAKSADKAPVQQTENSRVVLMLEKIKESGLEETKVVQFLCDCGSVDGRTKTIQEIHDKAPEVMELLEQQYDDIFERIKGA